MADAPRRARGATRKSPVTIGQVGPTRLRGGIPALWHARVEARPSRLELSISVAEMVAREVESQITSGSVQPGTHLGTKEDLRQRFGVAVGTINEATRLLTNRGLLTTRPGRGGGMFVTTASARVHPNGPADECDWNGATVAEYVSVRQALEPMVCREAARHHHDADIRELRQLLRKMEEHADRPLAYVRYAVALHRRIASVCHNALLQSLYLTVLDLIEDAMERQGLAPSDLLAHLSQHRQLVEAIDAGAGERLEAAIAQHRVSWGDGAAVETARVAGEAGG
jgi:DNA-binding FadR family transcriptional regulator